MYMYEDQPGGVYVHRHDPHIITRLVLAELRELPEDSTQDFKFYTAKYVSPWSRVLVDKLIKNCPPFMKYEGLVSCSQ
jgi:hypothetical protein